MFGNQDPLTGEKIPCGLAFSGRQELKMCCLNAASSTYFVADGQQAQCPYCFNLITAKSSYSPVLGELPEFPTEEVHPLADGCGVAMAVYDKSSWYDVAIERDLATRGLKGTAEHTHATINVAIRPISWFERDSLTVVSPKNVLGLKLFIGRLKDEFADKTPERSDLLGLFA